MDAKHLFFYIKSAAMNSELGSRTNILVIRWVSI